ncbi:MAG: hypothetical protein ACR2JR_05235 [Rubrobacteraceae bacterium]
MEFVTSEEARPGMKVRISDGHRRPALRGLIGTINQRYGDSSYVALEVLFENGQSELFWHHELSVVGRD